MSPPVDVKAAIRHAVSALHGAADDGADTRRYADALHEAGAAVDELIAVARDAAAVLQDKAGPMEQETPRRLYAALARVGGGA